MPKTTVCLSMASTYRFWFSVFGRMVLPRVDKMLWVSTSAGRASSRAVSIVHDALDGVGGQALAGAQHGDQLGDHVDGQVDGAGDRSG